MGLAVLGLAFLFFVVVAFFAAKTWHVGHVVAVVFLFLFTLVFLFLTATFFRTQEKFQPVHQKNLVALEAEQLRTHRLQYGDGSQPADETTLVGLQSLARAEQFERGRIWRNVVRLNAQNQIVLGMARWNNDGCLKVGAAEENEVPEPTPDPEVTDEPDAESDVAAADDAAENGDEAVATEPETPAPPSGSNPHGIAQNQFLYAFKEIPIQSLSPPEKEYFFGALNDGGDNFADRDTKQRCRLPLAYIGLFRVMETQEQAIMVVPEGILDRAQLQLMNTPGSWALYEQLPVDSHDLYTDVRQGSANEQEVMQKLSQLIPLARVAQFLEQPLSRRDYDAMLTDIMRHGAAANERTDGPDRVVVQVKFVREHEIPVDLEVEGDLPAAEQPFTVDGRAQVHYLMQNEPSKFAVGDIASFDAITANQLAQQGIVERQEATYVRPLRDYEFSLKDFESRNATLAGEIASVQATVDDLQGSVARLQDQQEKLRQEHALLAEDLQGFEIEKKQLEKMLAILEQRATALQSEVDRLVGSPNPIPETLPVHRP